MKRAIDRAWLLPALAAVAYFAARVLFSADHEDSINRVFNTAVFLLAAGGCFAAGRTFQVGDYLRVAWHLQAASSLLLAMSSALRDVEPADAVLLGRTALAFLANLITVLGALIFARAHHVAGLELPWSRPARLAFGVAVALVALAAAGPPVLLLVPAAMAGDLSSWMGIISAVGDFVFLVLIAPICMTAIALRGGLLTRPWVLLTASTVAWLIFDAQDSVLYLFPQLEAFDIGIITVPLRVIACVLLFEAAMAQRRLTLGLTERSGA